MDRRQVFVFEDFFDFGRRTKSEGELLSFRILEVGRFKKKKAAFNWHVLEVLPSMTFASALEALLSQSEMLSDASESTRSSGFRCFVSKEENSGVEARHEVPMATKVVRCCARFGQFVTFEAPSPELESEKERSQTSAFDVLLSASAAQGAAAARGKLPAKKGSEAYQSQDNFRSDWRLYNAIIDLLGVERVGFRNGSEQTAGKELVGVLADVLFEVLPAERRKRLEDRGLHFPGFFQPLTTSVYNDPSKHRHGRLPQLTRTDLSRMVEKLLRVRGLPTLQSASWGNVSAAITALATCLDKYGKYLETTTQRVNLMHHQMEPARLPKTGESDAVVRKEGCVRELALVARYKSLEQALAASEPYQKAFFVNDVAPADRQQHYRYVHEMQLPFAVELYHFHRGGNLGTLWWIWRAPEDPVNTRQDAGMKLIHQVTQDLKMYHTRAMRREFADRFKNVCSASPVVVREIYQELTGDSSAAPSAVEKIVQARLQLALDTEDPDIVYDLRHHNPARLLQVWQSPPCCGRGFIEDPVCTSCVPRMLCEGGACSHSRAEADAHLTARLGD